MKIRYSNVNYKNESKEIKQLFRQLHCYSYNALITIISNTEYDLKKYTIFLFNERPPKQLIWRNLIDCNVQHEFPIDFETVCHSLQINFILVLFYNLFISLYLLVITIIIILDTTTEKKNNQHKIKV